MFSSNCTCANKLRTVVSVNIPGRMMLCAAHLQQLLHINCRRCYIAHTVARRPYAKWLNILRILLAFLNTALPACPPVQFPEIKDLLVFFAHGSRSFMYICLNLSTNPTLRLFCTCKPRRMSASMNSSASSSLSGFQFCSVSDQRCVEIAPLENQVDFRAAQMLMELKILDELGDSDRSIEPFAPLCESAA